MHPKKLCFIFLLVLSCVQRRENAETLTLQTSPENQMLLVGEAQSPVFELLEASNFQMQFAVFAETTNTASVAKIFVYNLFQDFVEWEAVQNAQTLNGSFATGEAYLPLQQGNYSIRIRGCLSYGRTLSGQKECSAWSSPVSFQQDSKLPSSMLEQVRAYNDSTMAIFASSESLYLAIQSLQNTAANCSADPVELYKIAELDRFTVSSLNLLMNASKFPFEPDSGFFLQGGASAARFPSNLITLMLLISIYSPLEEALVFDRLSISKAQQERIDGWKQFNDEKRIRTRLSKLRGKMGPGKQAWGYVSAEIAVLENRLNKIITAKLENMSSKLKNGEILNQQDIAYIQARVSALGQDKIDELMKANQRIGVQARVEEIKSREFPTNADLKFLNANKVQFPEIITDEFISSTKKIHDVGVEKQQKEIAEAKSIKEEKKRVDAEKKKQLEEHAKIEAEQKKLDPIPTKIEVQAEIEVIAASNQPQHDPAIVTEEEIKVQTESHTREQSKLFVGEDSIKSKTSMGQKALIGTLVVGTLGAAAIAIGVAAGTGKFELANTNVCMSTALNSFKQSYENIKANVQNVLMTRESLMTSLSDEGFSL